ncbi:MAG: LptA/OstA family protein [Acidocella sp.]|nr:LptA/OstA family protein [Acidocella sp.]
MRQFLSACVIGLALGGPVYAQSLDLGGTPGGPPTPIRITASQGIEWQQASQTVTATGNAQAVRGGVTVDADQLIAHYRKKPGGSTPATEAKADSTDPLNQGGNELYELDAIGHVHIFTATDNAYADRAVYQLDQNVLVLTGQHLKLTTPHDVITARDAIEYHATTRVAVARGNALITADDGRSIAADTLVGYLLPASTVPSKAAPGGDELAQSGKLREVDAFGHVVIHTTSDTVTGDKGVYLPQTDRARLAGDVHIIHGPNELAGADALINMKTGVATLVAGPGGQVSGVILPNAGTPK